MVEDIILVPFGPTRPTPKGYRWCGMCDQTGKSWDHDKEEEIVCPCCRGKGHWNGADIDQYHAPNKEWWKQHCSDCMNGTPHDDPLSHEELQTRLEESKKVMADALALLAELDERKD